MDQPFFSAFYIPKGLTTSFELFTCAFDGGGRWRGIDLEGLVPVRWTKWRARMAEWERGLRSASVLSPSSPEPPDPQGGNGSEKRAINKYQI